MLSGEMAAILSLPQCVNQVHSDIMKPKFLSQRDSANKSVINCIYIDNIFFALTLWQERAFFILI